MKTTFSLIAIAVMVGVVSGSETYGFIAAVGAGLFAFLNQPSKEAAPPETAASPTNRISPQAVRRRWRRIRAKGVSLLGVPFCHCERWRLGTAQVVVSAVPFIIVVSTFKLWLRLVSPLYRWWMHDAEISAVPRFFTGDISVLGLHVNSLDLQFGIWFWFAFAVWLTIIGLLVNAQLLPYLHTRTCPWRTRELACAAPSRVHARQPEVG